jgi:hypothetical protein
LIDNKDLFLGKDDPGIRKTGITSSYRTFCTARYMGQIFPDATVLPYPESLDAGGLEMHHCCILGPHQES